MQQLNRVSNKFHELNDIADEVVNKFERKVTIRGANHPDEVMLLQVRKLTGLVKKHAYYHTMTP